MINFGCCCGFVCTISAPALTDLTGLTTVNGSPSASGGTLTLDLNEHVVFSDSAASADDATHLTAVLDTADATATLRFIIAYVDASNYLFGEFAIAAGAGTIRVGQRVAGSDSYLSDAETITDTGTDLTDPHELALCMTPGDQQASESLSTYPIFPRSVTDATGWTDADNVLLEDGNNASYILGTSSSTNGLNVDFPITVIPAGSTIDGIKVVVSCAHDGVSSDVTLDVDLGIGGFAGSKGPTSITTTGEYTFGDDADDWGLNGTAEDVNGEDLSVGIVFNNNDATELAQITVDYISLTFYYTTPDRGEGLLRMSLLNNGSALWQCASANILSPEGLQAGYRSQAGTWTLTTTEYSYQYAATRPSCPTCDCPAWICDAVCSDQEQPFTVLAEFEGSATDGDTSLCETASNDCDDIPAAAVIFNNFIFGDVPANSVWSWADSALIGEAGKLCTYAGHIATICSQGGGYYLAVILYVFLWRGNSGERRIISTLSASGSYGPQALAGWETTLGGEIDCMTLDQLEIPLEYSVNGDTELCNTTSIGSLLLTSISV